MDNYVMMAGLHMLLSDLQQSLYSPRHCSARLVEQKARGKLWSHRGLYFSAGCQIFGQCLNFRNDNGVTF